MHNEIIYLYLQSNTLHDMNEIIIERIIDCPIQEVWDAISNPNSLAKWFMKNNFRPELGASFQFMAPPNNNWDGLIDCKITHIEPPNRLSYSWTGSHIKYMTYVHWTLSTFDGRTKLALRHEGFRVSLSSSPIDWFAAHSKGWDNFLNQLSETVKQLHED